MGVGVGVGIGFGGGVGVSKKMNVKVFHVMGKALSGELSCPVTGLVIFIPNLAEEAQCFYLFRVSLEPGN